MKRAWTWIPAGVAVLFAVGAAVVAGQGAWHAADGGHAVFVSEGDAIEFDLSEMADGEVRVFGSADKQVTAERAGQTVTIKTGRHGDDRSVTCLMGRDTCKILTFDTDPEKVMIMIEKRRECRNGVGDCDAEVEIGEFGDATAHVVIEKLVECESGEDCDEARFDVVIAGPGHHASRGDGGPNFFLRQLGDSMSLLELGQADQVLLRCPEGDATLTVDAEEAQETFLCPRHSVPLEGAATPGRVKIIHRRPVQDDD